MKKRILGLLMALCLIVGLLPVVALADPAASVDFSLFLNTTANNQKTTVTLAKDATLYYKNITKAAHYNSKDLKCLEVGDATNWNLKLDYTGNVPVMTLKGVDINAGFVGIEFGSSASPIASDLVIVVESDSTITNEETTGNNYYNAAALALYTTGTVTVQSKNDAKLTLKSNNNYDNSCKGATLYAGGNLVLDKANVAIEGLAAWGDSQYGIYAVGNVTVSGGELTSRQTKDLLSSIKCANFEAKDGANVKIWAANSDSVGRNYVCIDAATIKINAANIDIGAYDTAFSVDPVVTNVSFYKGSTQTPAWSGTPGELTFKETSGDPGDYTTWKMVKIIAGEDEPAGTTATQPAGTTATQPAGTTATQPAGTTATQPAGTTATQPAGTTATQPAGTTATTPSATEPAVGDGVNFFLFLDTTKNNQKETITLAKGATLYFKNLAKTGVNGSGKQVDLKCLTKATEADWNLKLDYTGETPVMTLKGLDINSGIVGIDFGSKAAPVAIDLTIVIEGDSTIAIKETTGNNYYNSPALSLFTTGTATIKSKDGAKLTLIANNDYEGYNKNTGEYTSGRGTLYAAGNLVLNGANVALDGDAAWGATEFGIFAEGNVTVKGGELSAHLTKELCQAVKCANFEAKAGASVKIWALNSDSIGKDYNCIEADTIKINAANVDIGAFKTAFSVKPEITNCEFAKGSTQIPKWSGTPGELTFKEDSGDPREYTEWKQFQSKAGEFVEEPEEDDTTDSGETGATKPGATKPGVSKPGATKPGATKPGATKPGVGKPGTNGNDTTADGTMIGMWIALMAVAALGAAAVVSTKKYAK